MRTKFRVPDSSPRLQSVLTDMELCCIEHQPSRKQWAASTRVELAVNARIIVACLFQMKCDLRSDQLTTALLQKVVEHLTNAGYTPSVILKCTGFMRSFFEYQIKRGRSTYNPALAVEYKGRPDHQPRPVDLKVVAKLIGLIEPTDFETKRDKALLSLLMTTGCRWISIKRLCWNDVEIGTQQRVVNLSGKTLPYDVPLSAATVRLLMEYKASFSLPPPGHSLVFRGGRYKQSKSLNRDVFVGRIRRCLVAAALPLFTLHQIRHGVATLLADNNVSVYAIKRLLGHRSLSSSIRYIRNNPKIIRDLMLKYHCNFNPMAKLAGSPRRLKRLVTPLEFGGRRRSFGSQSYHKLATLEN